jgi:hypothetical protein
VTWRAAILRASAVLRRLAGWAVWASAVLVLLY